MKLRDQLHYFLFDRDEPSLEILDKISKSNIPHAVGHEIASIADESDHKWSSYCKYMCETDLNYDRIAWETVSELGAEDLEHDHELLRILFDRLAPQFDEIDHLA